MNLVHLHLRRLCGKAEAQQFRKRESTFLMLKSSREPAGLRLSNFARFAPLCSLLAIAALFGAAPVSAQSQGGWIANGWVTSVTVFDMTGNAALAQNSPLVTGHDYNMTLKITVPNTSTSTPTFQVSINNLFNATKNQSPYWSIHTTNYPGYNRTAFVPGGKTVTLNYAQGTVSLSAYFNIPNNFTIPQAKYNTTSGTHSITLHIPQTNVVFISVVPLNSTATGYFAASVQDQTTQTFLNNYNQTAALVPSGKIPSAYSTIVNPVLNESQTLNRLGLPDQGTALLSALVPSAFPAPPNDTLMTYLLIGLGVAIILVILFAVLTLRSRGRRGFSSSLIGEVQKDLAVLEVTAAKYDRAMADKLKSLRDKLGETS